MWQDTLQNELGLEPCSQQKNSQEVESFVQSFEDDTMAEDSQYAFWSYLGAFSLGCVLGASGSLFRYTTSLSEEDKPEGAETAAIVGSGLTAGSLYVLLKIIKDVKGHGLAAAAGSVVCIIGSEVTLPVKD